jgi:hypothetical protein
VRLRPTAVKRRRLLAKPPLTVGLKRMSAADELALFLDLVLARLSWLAGDLFDPASLLLLQLALLLLELMSLLI